MQWAVCDREHRHFVAIADTTVLRLTHVLLRATETIHPNTPAECVADNDPISRQIARILTKDPLSLAAVLWRLPKDIAAPAENDDLAVVLGRSVLRGIQAFLRDEQDWFPWELAGDDRENVTADEKNRILQNVRTVYLIQQLAQFQAKISKCQGLRLIPFATVLLVQRLFGSDHGLDVVATLEHLLGTKARERLEAAVEVVELVAQQLKQDEDGRLDASPFGPSFSKAEREPSEAGEDAEPREYRWSWNFSAAELGFPANDVRLKEGWLSAVRRAYRLTRHWQRREPGCRQLWETAFRLAKETAKLKLRFEEVLEQAKLDALAEFAAGAGHEINNPLAIISGHAQLLFRQVADPEGRRMLATIVAQAQRAHEMITDARLFARPPKPVFGPVNYYDLLQKVVEEWTPQAELRHVRLELVSQPGTPGLFEGVGDRYQVLAALTAIVKNALEAVPESGIVKLAIEADDNEIRISVTDNGPGITAEVRAHLFDPFFSGRQAGRGLGLGLSKAWRIVTLHGGKIEVNSTPGKETTFRVCLPRRPPRCQT